MPGNEEVTPIAGSHVWVAAVIALVVLAVATWLLCGLSLTVMRKLVLGMDKRASTSKFQAAAWTYAICFALLTMLAGHVLYADFDPGWEAFLDAGLNSDYLWLLGIPSAGLVGAKAITQGKVVDDPGAKPEKQDGTASLKTRLRELGSNDNDADPQPLLADFQYLIFNTIALVFFLSAFVAHPELGLPSLPDSLIALTGVSATSYLAAKATSRSAAPSIVSVRPGTVKLGPNPTTLTVSGVGFTSPLAPGPPAVMLGGVDLPVNPGATATQLTATVPDATAAAAMGLVPGQRPLVVLSPAGTPSEPVMIDVSPSES